METDEANRNTDHRTRRKRTRDHQNRETTTDDLTRFNREWNRVKVKGVIEPIWEPMRQTSKDTADGKQTER
jgi:hypothetical protein